jgi:hypothetical protein
MLALLLIIIIIIIIIMKPKKRRVAMSSAILKARPRRDAVTVTLHSPLLGDVVSQNLPKEIFSVMLVAFSMYQK